MTEVAKTVEPKKEATLAELVTSAKPVVEKPKAKEAKPAVKAKPIAAVSASFDDEVSYEPDLVDNDRQAHFRDPARDYPLKDVDMNRLRPKLNNSPIPYYRKHHSNDEITYPQTFKHIIIGNTLYVIDNRSGIILSEQMWLNNNNPFEYLNEDMSNMPENVLVLENATILSSYMGITGHNLVKQSSIKTTYNIGLTKATLTNSTLRSTSSATVNDCSIRSSHLSGGSLRLNNLTICDYFITVGGIIRLSEIRFSNGIELRINGENIKDVEITKSGCIHNVGARCRFDYYGDTPISITSNRRVDNGFFMGAVPIPFIKTDGGVLVGGTVFTYSDFKQFIETTLDKLSPVKPVEGGNYHSFRPIPPLPFGYPGSIGGAVQANVPGEILNSLFQLIQNKGDIISYHGRNNSAEKYTEVDSLLTLTNEQISVLAGQISSRLRLFKELDAFI